MKYYVIKNAKTINSFGWDGIQPHIYPHEHDLILPESEWSIEAYPYPERPTISEVVEEFPALTPVQFFKYLYIAKGIKDTDIQALIADNITDEQQKYFAMLEFSREKVILRNHWLVDMLANSPLINMTPEEVDQAFYEASLL